MKGFIMNRKKINKHSFKYEKANTLAIKAIKLNGRILDGSTIYDYDKDTNTLSIITNGFAEYYEPKILDSEIIFPFFKEKETRKITLKIVISLCFRGNTSKYKLNSRN